MKVGDLVKFVGVANYYKNSVGIITKIYSTHGIKKNGQLHSNSAIVYMSDRPEGRSLQQGSTPCFHPLGLTELEVIS
jgi:hypothetical protein